MRVSKNRVNQLLQTELFRTLHQAVADLKTPQEVKAFFESYLSEAEHITLAKRVGVSYWLDKGRSYQNIRENLKVSSASIAAMQDLMKSDGVRMTLQKVKADEWANVWAEKIQKFIKRS